MFIIRLDPGDEFITEAVNPALAGKFGLDCAAIAGTRVRDVVPAESLETVLGRYRQCITSGEPMTYEEIGHAGEADPHAWNTLCWCRPSTKTAWPASTAFPATWVTPGRTCPSKSGIPEYGSGSGNGKIAEERPRMIGDKTRLLDRQVDIRYQPILGNTRGIELMVVAEAR